MFYKINLKSWEVVEKSNKKFFQEWFITTNESEANEEQKKSIKDFNNKGIISWIESEMSSLNADRKNLQDLIELWLQAEWDIEQVEWIMVKLWELAEKRKQLKEVS